MSPNRFATFCLLLSAALLTQACKKATTASQSAPPQVTVAKPIAKKLTEWDEFTGRLAAVASVEVRARVSGYLQSTHFQEGTEVKEGDLLFIIDPRRYEADLAGANAEVARAKSALELATAEAGRAAKLVQTKAISAEEADVKVKTQQQAMASLQAAQARVDAVKLEVEYTRVTAPISGRIGHKRVTEGNLITGGPNGATLLTTIVSLDPIYCYFDVDERSSLKYRELAKQGKRESALAAKIPAWIGLAHHNGFPIEGVIDFVDNELSAHTGSIRARGLFPNQDRMMAPGLFARVRIPGSGDYEAMLVRDSAIASDQGRTFVWVIDAEGKATQRPVQTGPLEEGLRIIREGLKAEDRVVINGLMAIRNGVPVQAQEAEMKLEATAATTAAVR